MRMSRCCLMKAAADAKNREAVEKLDKAETAAIKKEAPAPAPKPAPAPAPKPAPSPAPAPAPASSGGAALGKVSGAAPGGKVLPKEELDPAVLQLLKVSFERGSVVTHFCTRRFCLTLFDMSNRNKQTKLALRGGSPLTVRIEDSSDSIMNTLPPLVGEASHAVPLTKLSSHLVFHIIPGHRNIMIRTLNSKDTHSRNSNVVDSLLDVFKTFSFNRHHHRSRFRCLTLILCLSPFALSLPLPVQTSKLEPPSIERQH